MAEFMFATGIECSYPTIDGGRWRIDQLKETRHYENWKRDLELVREVGLRYLRYGPPLHLILLGPDKYDWTFTDQVCAAMQELDIVPIMENDPRVYFVPSHPVLQTAMPELMKGLGVSWPGQAVMKWEQFERRGMHNLKYGTAQRKALTIGKPLVTAALVVGGLAALTRLISGISAPDIKK